MKLMFRDTLFILSQLFALLFALFPSIIKLLLLLRLFKKVNNQLRGPFIVVAKDVLIFVLFVLGKLNALFDIPRLGLGMIDTLSPLILFIIVLVLTDTVILHFLKGKEIINNIKLSILYNFTYVIFFAIQLLLPLGFY